MYILYVFTLFYMITLSESLTPAKGQLCCLKYHLLPREISPKISAYWLGVLPGNNGFVGLISATRNRFKLLIFFFFFFFFKSVLLAEEKCDEMIYRKSLEAMK